MNILEEARKVRDKTLKLEDVAPMRRKQVEQLSRAIADQPDTTSYTKRYAISRGARARIGKATAT